MGPKKKKNLIYNNASYNNAKVTVSYLDEQIVYVVAHTPYGPYLDTIAETGRAVVFMDRRPVESRNFRVYGIVHLGNQNAPET